LKESLVCIVKNALESSETAGTVYMYITANERSISVTVKDFGNGIPLWKQLLIELPLVTFKRNGSGVGLPFARKVICHELGGSVSVTSTVGVGTTVECYIPKHQSTCTQIHV
jgi:signal transduction histidine kinase